MSPNVGFLPPNTNEISVPYMSAYEASNAFGYFHACSLIREYSSKKNLDLLNITPGAVVTEATAEPLVNAPFSVNAEKFVGSVIKHLGGNVQSGSYYAYWGHEVSGLFAGILPQSKMKWTKEVGSAFATHYKQKRKSDFLS